MGIIQSTLMQGMDAAVRSVGTALIANPMRQMAKAMQHDAQANLRQNKEDLNNWKQRVSAGDYMAIRNEIENRTPIRRSIIKRGRKR